MIKVRGLSKRYGSITACSDISFEINPGRVTALLGPNGAGKSTILNVLCGTLLPTSGEVSIQGYDLSLKPIEARHQIGCMSENTPLYEDMTVSENLSFIAGMYGIQSRKIKTVLEKVLFQCHIEDVAGRMTGNLSKGYKQRVALAQSLINDPAVLILDEPTNGLDPLQLNEFRKIIRAVSKEKTILLSTHIMQEVESLCSDILMLHRGKLIEQGSIAEICLRTNTLTIEQAFLTSTASLPEDSGS